MIPRLLAAASLAALCACASVSGSGLSPDELTVIGQESGPDGLDPIAEAAFWGTRYDRNPSDATIATSFSRALRSIENNEESLRVMGQMAQRAPEDARVQLEYGKSLIANERPYEAVRPIERSIELGLYEDWSAYSAYGVALDKTGRHRDAREQYDRALALSPGNAQVLNNKGLSYALQGDGGMAERTLRAATGGPGGTARMRQNLALVLGLNGKTGEAEMLARSDLPPRVADGNVAYFRSLVAQPSYWGGLTHQNADLPNFDELGPETPTYEPAAAANTAPKPAGKPKPADAPNEVEPFEPAEGKPAAGVSASADAKADTQVAATEAPMALSSEDGV
ncbi:tetratricopeptide repeat protein [Parvularcula dongshanensis]|uniref:Flp pilus assembly protein TadD n=1 Tax=Parvularcula dongshanensis TaxID=1173995 RepID=A0A840I0B9_9PROT|nr:tetratricopeptide repeat protein [Parvularcula dongshanensis]MBB4657731.1 Flp pilus assembly protein TadD [Parvularcula dongshanensis]